VRTVRRARSEVTTTDGMSLRLFLQVRGGEPPAKFHTGRVFQINDSSWIGRPESFALSARPRRRAYPHAFDARDGAANHACVATSRFANAR